MKDKAGSICFFNSAKVWGGGEKWHFDNATALHKRGYNVIAIAGKNSDLYRRFKDSDIPVYSVRIHILSFLNPFKRLKIKKILKQNKADSIIINLSADLKTAAPVAAKLGVSKIIYRRGSAIPIKANPLNKYLLRKKVSHILANSEETKRTVLQHIRMDKSKITVIYNGIKIENYECESKSNSKFVIGGLGRLNKQKAFHWFIDTLAELHRRGNKYKAVIGGKGELEDELKGHAEKMKVGKYIEFSGFAEDVNEFMKQADIFFLSSKWEGFGYVLAEAAACGKPCVAFDTSSNPELIIHGETGFLAKAFDINEAADYIEKLAKDNSLRTQMGEAARKRAARKFSFERSISELIAFLEI